VGSAGPDQPPWWPPIENPRPNRSEHGVSSPLSLDHRHQPHRLYRSTAQALGHWRVGLRADQENHPKGHVSVWEGMGAKRQGGKNQDQSLFQPNRPGGSARRPPQKRSPAAVNCRGCGQANATGCRVGKIPLKARQVDPAHSTGPSPPEWPERVSPTGFYLSSEGAIRRPARPPPQPCHNGIQWMLARCLRFSLALPGSAAELRLGGWFHTAGAKVSGRLPAGKAGLFRPCRTQGGGGGRRTALSAATVHTEWAISGCRAAARETTGAETHSQSWATSDGDGLNGGGKPKLVAIGIAPCGIILDRDCAMGCGCSASAWCRWGVVSLGLVWHWAVINATWLAWAC